eukprot:TRINITY_DN7754_c0_g1_i1.p1 TRINITY_DN7754_c0_g1~~TRINITY_DN7754_c0_g1_i1.p1  ORF type:complete len:385 (-),score=62.62 TRINITY_DN7754_c0_g1_i1:271-1425(-)
MRNVTRLAVLLTTGLIVRLLWKGHGPFLDEAFCGSSSREGGCQSRRSAGSMVGRTNSFLGLDPTQAARKMGRPRSSVSLLAGFDDFSAAELRQALQLLQCELPGGARSLSTKKRMIECLSAEGMAPIDVLGVLNRLQQINGHYGKGFHPRERSAKKKKEEPSPEKKSLWYYGKPTLRAVLKMVGYLEDTSGYSKRHLIKVIQEMDLTVDHVNHLVEDRKFPTNKGKQKKKMYRQRRQSYAIFDDDDFDRLDAEQPRRQRSYYEYESGYDEIDESGRRHYGYRARTPGGSFFRSLVADAAISADVAMQTALREGWDAGALCQARAAQLLGLSMSVTGGLASQPSPEEVRQLRKHMVKQWHPDKHQGSETAAKALQLAMAACDILG